jgi:16S rRNA (uracil1498-N3)-methyltransferase
VQEALRHSAAHVLVHDVESPQPDDGSLHHLARVLRLRRGEAVTVTDGAGSWRSCEFTGDGVDPAGEVMRDARPDPRLTVAVAPPKGDRLEWLVAKCTEVGIDRLVVLDAEHSVVRWAGERAARQLTRLRRISVEAAMQSRRVWLPEISGPVPAIDVLPAMAAAEPGGRPLHAADTAIAVGPEGGWAPKELEVATSTVALGPNVLRAETAAVAAAVLLVSLRQLDDRW